MVAAAEEWQAGPFDAVLVDAPCTSTGTIRRHPDIPWRRTAGDIEALAALQQRLLDRAIALVKPGGTVVFCTCSLEPEEGEDIIRAALGRDQSVRRSPIAVTEFAGLEGFVTPLGELRTLTVSVAGPRPPHGRPRRIFRRPPRAALAMIPKSC